MKPHLLALALTPFVALAACSSEPASEPTAGASSAAPTETAVPEPSATPETAPTPAPANLLRLEGLGDLEIGKPVPKGSSWKADGVQASDTCLTYNSASYPGVYAIVEDGAVRRITAGEGSRVKLAEGIGVGDSEADVKKWFAGFREAPHTYEEAPAKYLTAPNGESGDPALRFEIDASRHVSFIHIGTWPVLGYVEGCA
ncbi:hypothetical protein [Novosphingobium colocasiae]|uniref:hypothetical protein n=1 Tax=Novosphingobium colocasiae TaxID=1256513 RepID=UPI0035ADBB36